MGSEGYGEGQEGEADVGEKCGDCLGGGGQGGAGGADVVDKEDVFALEPFGMRETEDTPYVVQAFLVRELCLSLVRPDGTEIRADRNAGFGAESKAYLLTLVITSKTLFDEVHRHRYQHVNVRQKTGIE